MGRGYSQIARILQERRAGIGLSQRELGQRSGLTQPQISRIENGAVDMRISSLLALAKELGLELSFTRQTLPHSGVQAWEPSGTESRAGSTKDVYGLADDTQRPGIFGDIAEELL